VLGDAAGASATDGEALLRRLGDDLARAVVPAVIAALTFPAAG
jgi:hypothetical protein